MSKEILRFKGLTLNKDEQSAQHGELALCGGVELHDGALRPSVLQGGEVPNALTVSGSVAKLLYVHDMPSYRHYIGVVGRFLYWFYDDGTLGNPHTYTPYDYICDFATSEEVISVNSVGNTLIVMTDEAVYYILWKDTDYKYLGTQIPFVSIKFRPSENYTGKYDRSTVKNNSTNPESEYAYRAMAVSTGDALDLISQSLVNIKSDHKTDVTEAVWALINQTNNTIARDGHFYAPFFIRYCYRLYDGSMVMHSAPVYMNVSLPKTYRVYCPNIVNTGGNYSIEDIVIISDGGESFITGSLTFCYQPNNVGIRYRTDSMDPNLYALMDDWLDIVKSIDIFVSPMLPRETSGEQMQIITPKDTDLGVRDDVIASLGRSSTSPDYFTIDIPMQEETQYLQKLKDNSTFFKIKSFNLEIDNPSTVGVWRNLDYDKNAIANITVQEQMKDDCRTHNQLLPISGKSGMYVYNHRLNLYNMIERLFNGFEVPYMINDLPVSSIASADPYPSVVTIDSLFIELSTEYGKRYVGGLVGIDVREYCLCKSLLFYPDSRATKMYIYYSYNGTSYEAILAMEPHNFLNGAIATSLFFETALPRNARNAPPYPIVSPYFPQPNRVITSEADNPFYFPIEGRNTVGNGSIIGIAAVTRALSQGQVGDHDLVVFATDGIWVMKVASTGTYSAVHNISREVCSNAKSICQLDQSIVFATQRSLSRFVESNVVSISDVLDGPIPDLLAILPGLDAAFPASGTPAQQVIRKLLSFGTPAVEMFNDGSVFYDYASSRVVVLPAANASGVVTGGVAMVFSIRDQAWSTMPIPAILSVVPGYPSPFVQTDDGKVTILDKPYDYDAGGNAVPGMIITRELTFSDTMDAIRGFRQLSDLDDETATLTPRRPMLYFFGSNDQRTWKQIGYSDRWFHNYMPGVTFRFFRIAIYMQMKPSEEYQHLVLEVVNKYAKL